MDESSGMSVKKGPDMMYENNDYNNDYNEFSSTGTGTRQRVQKGEFRELNEGAAVRHPDNAVTDSLATFTGKTFLWMFAGLMTTFGIAIASAFTGIAYAVATGPMMLVITIAELFVVIYLSSHLDQLSVGSARGLFFGYAALTGLVFSVYTLYFGAPAIIFVFGLTAIFFGVMAAVTKLFHLDLSRMGTFISAGLMFMMVVLLINLFVQSSGFTMMVSLIGVFLFLACTAYDTSKLSAFYSYFRTDSAQLSKASIYAALQLYLDFINLFLYLLRLFTGSASRRS